MDDSEFGNPVLVAETFENGNDRSNFVPDNMEHVLYAWINLADLGILDEFLQVIDAEVSVDLSTNEPVRGGVALVQQKRKSNEDNNVML
jgi:hypothetical protein